MAEQTYKNEMFCDHCDEETIQIVYSSGHERDSSQDWQVCTKCGWRLNGISGEWNEFMTPDEVKKHYKKYL